MFPLPSPAVLVPSYDVSLLPRFPTPLGNTSLHAVRRRTVCQEEARAKKRDGFVNFNNPEQMVMESNALSVPAAPDHDVTNLSITVLYLPFVHEALFKHVIVSNTNAGTHHHLNEDHK